MAPRGGPPYLTSLISRRSLLAQAGLLAAGAAGAWWLREHVIWAPPKAVFRNGSSGSGWLSFQSSAPALVLIDVFANGVPVPALLDSGAQSTVVDRALAARLGLSLSPITPVVAFGVSGAPQVGRSARLALAAGDAVFEDVRAAVLELAPIAAAAGRPFSIVIGQDVLSTVVADIDFPRARAAFHDPARYVPPAGLIQPPARRSGRELLTTVEVEGRPLEVVLDTGASGALALSPASARSVGLLDGRDQRRAPSITFGGVSNDRVVRAASLRFADAEVEDVLVHIYEPPRGGRVPPGLLGVEVLERYRVILDHAQGRLHLLPSDDVRPRRSRRRSAGSRP